MPIGGYFTQVIRLARIYLKGLGRYKSCRIVCYLLKAISFLHLASIGWSDAE